MQEIVRTVNLENGNKVNFSTGPKYPFWKISFEKGGIPAELSGQYTDFDKAVYAAEKYLAKRPRNKTSFKGEVKTKES